MNNLYEDTYKHVLALAWNIATEPRLYRELAPNPYTHRALQIISERFPKMHTADIIKAIILAEPEGEYDRDFRRQPIIVQSQELRKQRDVFTKIQKRLTEYYKKHAKELEQLSREFVYERLSQIAFETGDIKKIEEDYAQSQRRDAKLLIVIYIDRLSTTGVHKDKTALVRPLLQTGFVTLALILFFTFIQIKSPIHSMQAPKQIIGINQGGEQGLPMRLRIPAINVDASIQYLGLTPTGAVGVPNNTTDVGWFDLGPRPGEKGSAVIDGHFDGADGTPGVFTHLDKLQRGDKIYVQDGSGKSIAFVVRKTTAYDPGHADDVFSPSETSHLNLITCDGVWDEVKKSYTKRLVVFADIID